MIFTRHSPVDLFRLLALMPRIISQTQGQRYKSEILSLTLSQLFISFTLSLVALSQKGSAAISLPSSSSQSPVQLKLNTACNSEAIIEWIFQAPNPSILIKCELTYSIVGQNQAQIINIYLDPLTHTFNLFNLTQGVNYSVFLVCDNCGKSKSIFFISGSVCQHDHPVTNETLEAFDTETNAQLSYAQTSSYDAVEWPIAITFAAAGLIICAVVAFYMWKKYQRRQRILRIFRQGQNDPFQALYSPTQDSYSF